MSELLTSRRILWPAAHESMLCFGPWSRAMGNFSLDPGLDPRPWTKPWTRP